MSKRIQKNFHCNDKKGKKTMVDKMVKEGQEWLNTTYSKRNGFNTIPKESIGKTNWTTMYALTRALQLELGITATSDAFGPTTLRTLTSKFGTISKTSKIPTNVIKIIQTALYCKGYSAGQIDGKFNTQTLSGIAEVKEDMGLSANSSIEPKIFKALLTMDAYVLLKDYGGNAKIRLVQQLFNKKYAHRSDYFYMPCDGIYSRDTQKALVFAIQYEGGMADGVANGNFGPGTQNIIRNNTIRVGISGIFTYLFKAAMIFNRFDCILSNTFTPSDMSTLRMFQSFCHISVTGTGTFETWASLLVSTGDPNRRGKACDCVTEITDAKAKALKAAGYETVGRYLSNVEGTSLNKKIQPNELNVIFNNGLTIFPIYQTWGGEASYFTSSQGELDAVQAYKAAKNYGFKSGTIIYFAVDYDAYGTDIENNIIPHFQAANNTMSALGGEYQVGVYGPRNVCIKVSEKTSTVTSFVSGMSTGFSGNLGYPLPQNWAFDQISTIYVGSGNGAIEIDNNIKSGRDLGQSTVNKPTDDQYDVCSFVDNVYNLAVQYKKNNNTKKSTTKLVVEYFRGIDYNNALWANVAGELETNFISYVNNSTSKKYTSIIDPATQRAIGLSHLFAAADGVLFNGVPDYSIATLADGAGWMGDLISTITDYRNYGNNYPTVKEFAEKYIAAKNIPSLFGINDMLEDIDGWNIAHHSLTQPTIPINILFRDYYKKYYLNRYSYFFETRFGGNRDLLTTAVGHVMFDSPTTIVGIFRIALQEYQAKKPVLEVSGSIRSEIAKVFIEKIITNLEN